MFDFLTVIEDINKAIFTHNKAKSGNHDLDPLRESSRPPLRESPRSPLRESPRSPLKYSPKINPENDFSVFFFTIFNLCSGGERRDCVREKERKFANSAHIEHKEGESLYEVSSKMPSQTNFKLKLCKEGEDLYEVSSNSKILGSVILSKDDFQYSDNNEILFKIKPFGDYDQIPRNALITNPEKVKQILRKTFDISYS